MIFLKSYYKGWSKKMKHSLINYPAIRWMTVTFITIVVILGLTGCPPPGPDKIERTLTSSQANRINNASTTISQVIATNQENGSASPLNDARVAASQQAGVSNAVIENNALFVQYTDGGSEIWMHDAPADTPPVDITDVQAYARRVISQLNVKRGAIGTHNAVIINSFASDPDRAERLRYFDSMDTMLQAAGFNVTRYTEDTCTPEIMKSLQNNSLILLSGHGSSVDNEQEKYSTMAGRWKFLYYFTADYYSNRIIHMHDVDNRGDFFAVTADFWKKAYSNNHFNHGLFMNLCCYGSAFPSYRQALYDVGIDEYTGWSSAQGIAVFTAFRQIAYMVGGETLQKAVDSTPDSSLHQYFSDYGMADFWYGPDNKRDITLGINTSTNHQPVVNITSPSNDSTIDTVGCLVNGTITNWSSSYRAAINADGKSSALTVSSNGSFSQMVGLSQGVNTIQVTVFTPTASSDTVSVTANIPSQLLMSELTWKTNDNDLDLHLTPDWATSFSYNDCYYMNKNPSWGASLDFDDVDGNGPEHISADSLPSGRYKLWVDYYATHGVSVPVGVSVSISTLGQNSQFFRLPESKSFIYSHQTWDVCYVDFPSGAITSIERMGSRSVNDRMIRPAKK